MNPRIWLSALAIRLIKQPTPRLVPCTFNTQQELDLKHVYEPVLNRLSIQNASLCRQLARINLTNNLFTSNATGFTKFFLAIGVGFMCVTTSAQVGVDPWKCDQNFYKTVPLSGKVQEAVIAEMRQTCPELGDPANMSVFTEATAYARQGVICFASLGQEIKKLKSGSMKHSQFFGPLKASPRCESYLVKEWGLNSIAEQGSTSRPLAPTNSSNTQQLTQQSQQLTQQSQQLAQQNQQSAQQNQSRTDQERQGKRKTHNDAAQAHSCIEIDKEPGLFGGFKNTCDYKVNYDFCNFKPKKDSWASSHDCEKKHGIGADAVGPGKSSAAHNRNTEMVYWFACKDPSWPVDSVFVLGKGIEARCHN